MAIQLRGAHVWALWKVESVRDNAALRLSKRPLVRGLPGRVRAKGEMTMNTSAWLVLIFCAILVTMSLTWAINRSTITRQEDEITGWRNNALRWRTIAISRHAEVLRAGFDKTAEPSGIIEIPPVLDDTQFDTFRKRWDERHHQTTGLGRPVTLDSIITPRSTHPDYPSTPRIEINYEGRDGG